MNRQLSGLSRMTFDVSRLERTEQIVIRQVISETTDQYIFIATQTFKHYNNNLIPQVTKLL